MSTATRSATGVFAALFLLMAAGFTAAPTATADSAPSVAPSADTTLVTVLDGLDLNLGTLLRTGVGWNRPGVRDGFDVGTARLRMTGSAPGAQFFVQTDFTRSPTLLDARVRVPVTDRLLVAAGVYKAPFSGEQLTSTSALPFIDRAQVVGALAPGRQIGASVQADLVPGRVRFHGGVFNGNGRNFSMNDNDRFLYAGRLTGTLPLESAMLDVGVNAAYSRDDGVLLSGVTGAFAGNRTLYGADAQLRWNGWLLGGEVLGAYLDPESGSAIKPVGYSATVAYRADRHQVLARADAFDPDVPTIGSSEAFVIGHTAYWTPALKTQINYRAPFDDAGDGSVVVLLQLALN